MSKQTDNSLFMFPPDKNRYGRLYQGLLAGIMNYDVLGERLVRYSEQAHAFRDYDTLQELALMLSNLPSEHYRGIGQYYTALGVCRNGIGSIDLAQNILESLACVGPTKYRAKSLLLLSAISQVRGNIENAFKFYEETVKVEILGSATILAIKGIAVLKSREGYHKHALKDLERFYQIARYASPHVYFDYLNSLAVELLEEGRLEEARNISNIVLASPYAFAYPEWRETAGEIRLKLYRSRSFVSFTQVAPYNVVPLPERSNEVIETAKQPGKVLSYTDWTNKMVKEPNGNGDEEKPDDLSSGDLVMKLLNLVTDDAVTDEQRRKILEYAAKVISQTKK